MEETKAKKKRNKRSGGVYEHGLVTEYETEPAKDKKEQKSVYNDLPTINVPNKKEDEPNYVEDTQSEPELTKIAQNKITPRSTPRSKIDTEQLNKILVKMPKSQLKELITDVINIDEAMMILIKKYADGQANLRIQPFKKDWNKDYQAILSEPDSESKFKKLYHLAHDFVYAANTYAKIIISELALPPDEKTIELMDIGGIAGGTKFVCQNILFKFVLDFELKEGLWMYGGDSRNDEYAMKAAAHELKGLIGYYSCNIPGLNFPLMAMIDYKGFRVIAMSILPINSKTIKYGSSDAGTNVHCDVPELNEKMDRAATILNLKKHVIGAREGSNIRLSSAGDLEGHLGLDGRFYLLDFARTLPPEGPDVDPKFRESRQVYYKLLRQEFVRIWPTPLCSDAFTAWQKNDPDKQQHDLEIMKATKYLLTRAIPEFAEKLDKLLPNDNASSPSFVMNRAAFAAEFAKIHKQFDFSRDLDPSKSSSGDSAQAMEINHTIEEMHRHGINIRHLGLLRTFSKSKPVRKLLLLEMVARVIKDVLRSQMRNIMREVRVLSEEPFKQIVLKTFNYTLGRDPQSGKFWAIVKNRLIRKFRKALADNEISSDLHDSINMFALFSRLQELVGVELTTEAKQELRDFPDSFEFVSSDVLDVYAKVKHLNIIDYAEGMALSFMAKKTDGKRERLRLLKLSSQKFESALRALPDSFMTLYQWGCVLVEEANMNVAAKAQQSLEKACEKFREAILINPKFQECQLRLGDALIQLAKMRTTTDVRSRAIKKLYKQASEELRKSLDINADFKGFESVFQRIQTMYITASDDKETHKRRKLMFYGISKICKHLYNQLLQHRESILRVDQTTVEALGRLEEMQKIMDEHGETLKAIQGLDFGNMNQGSTNNSNNKENTATRPRSGSTGGGANPLRVSAKAKNPLYVPGFRGSIDILNSKSVNNNYSQPIMSKSKSLTATNSEERDLVYESPIYNQAMEDSELSQLFRGAYTEDLAVPVPNDTLPSPRSKGLKKPSLTKTKSTSAPKIQRHRRTLSADPLGKDDMTHEDRVNYYSRIITEVASIWSDSLLQYASMKKSFGSAEILFTKSADVLTKLIAIDSKNDDIIRRNVEYLKTKAKANKKLHFAISELYKVLENQENHKNDESMLYAWGECLLEYASCFFTEIERFTQLHCAAGEKFERLLKTSSTYLDNYVINLLCKQDRTTLEQLILLLPSCPSFLERIKALSDKFTAISFEGSALLTDAILEQILPVLPHLQEVNFSFVKAVTDSSLAVVAKRAPQLQKINLSNCTNITDEGIRVLCSSLKELQEINLANSSITDESVQHMVTHLPKLKKIDLERCKITNAALRHIAQAQNLSCLESLSFNRCLKIEDSGLAAFEAKKCPSMRSIELNGCSQLTVEAIRSILVSFPNLTSLSLESDYSINDECVSIISGLSKLEKLNIRNTKVTSKGLVHLTALLNLTYLDISKCPILPKVKEVNRIPDASSSQDFTSEEPGNFTSIVHNFEGIEREELIEVDKSLEAFMEVVGPRLNTLLMAQCPTIPNYYFSLLGRKQVGLLQTLDLSENRELTTEALISITKGSPNLESLTLDACRLTDNGAFAIADNCLRIKHLNLSRCSVSDSALSYLGLKLNKCETLILAGNFAMTDKAMTSIANHMKSLRHVNVGSCNKIKDDGIIDLLYAIPEVEYINLENCNISNRTLQKIGAICTNLKTLIVARCTTLNDGGIEHLVSGSKTLRKLDLTGLNLIGDRALIAITKYLPYLEHIVLKNCDNVTEKGIATLESNKALKSMILPEKDFKLIKELGSALKDPKINTLIYKPILINSAEKRRNPSVGESELLEKHATIHRRRRQLRKESTGELPDSPLRFSVATSDAGSELLASTLTDSDSSAPLSPQPLHINVPLRSSNSSSPQAPSSPRLTPR
eukprot:TRINITY_DN1931_c0_g1_i1.p1 TRINITY_DN1931_c0_g1~~TRINITY_DN1931_c0_g1_i1.p1  ORF type:complete len:1922 (+),score=411.10 TRINITY_DN1931_c0_g1_i1:83-5848(+)